MSVSISFNDSGAAVVTSTLDMDSSAAAVARYALLVADGEDIKRAEYESRRILLTAAAADVKRTSDLESQSDADIDAQIAALNDRKTMRVDVTAIAAVADPLIQEFKDKQAADAGSSTTTTGTPVGP